MGWKEPKSNYTAESQVKPEIFNTLAENEKYLNETKITIGQVQNAEVNSTQSATRENVGDKETVKGFFGKVRKWFADLKALAFKGSVGTADIDNSAVTSAKLASSAVTSTKIGTGAVTSTKLDTNAVTTVNIADKAVTDAKIDSVSASKVTGLAAVATSGSYNDLLDKPSIGGGGGFFSPTFIVDSDAALEQWADNDKTCDFSKVLIKKGTWKCNKEIKFKNYRGGQNTCVGINLTQTKTKMVIGEEGSKLYFYVADTSTRDVYGLSTEYGDSKKETDKGYLFYGVNVEVHGANVMTDQSAYCFSSCCNLIDCTAKSDNAYSGYAFMSCMNMTNCSAEVNAQNAAYAFFGCDNLTRCVGHANAWNANRKWAGGSSVGFRDCENITKCKGSATCTPATSDYTAYGFSGCKAVSRCSKNETSSTATFTSSYYSNTRDDAYACANTANGGFNDTANS